MSFIYHPSCDQGIISSNPVVSVISISNPYSFDELNCIDTFYDGEVEEELVKELSCFEETTANKSQIPKYVNPVGTHPKSVTYTRDRFKVTDSSLYYNSDDALYEDTLEELPTTINTTIINTSTQDEDDLIDMSHNINEHIKSLIKERDSKLETINEVLKYQLQLWNIIIPIYTTHSGINDAVIEDEIYFDEGTVFPQYNLDFLLRNKGFFMEIIPTYDDTETWETIESKNPITTLHTFGLNIVPDNTYFHPYVVGSNLKMTFVQLKDKPESSEIGCWSCYKYNSLHMMKLSGTLIQYPIRQILEKELNDIYQQNKPELFKKSNWCKPIPISKGEQYVSATDNYSILTIKERLPKINQLLREKYNFEGLTMADIWTIFIDCKIKTPNYELLGKKGLQKKKDKELANRMQHKINNYNWYENEDLSHYELI